MRTIIPYIFGIYLAIFISMNDDSNNDFYQTEIEKQDKFSKGILAIYGGIIAAAGVLASGQISQVISRLFAISKTFSLIASVCLFFAFLLPIGAWVTGKLDVPGPKLFGKNKTVCEIKTEYNRVSVLLFFLAAAIIFLLLISSV